MHILHTILYIFPKVLEGEFVKKIKFFLVGNDFLNDLLGYSGVILYEEIRCYSSVRVKVLKTIFIQLEL